MIRHYILDERGEPVGCDDIHAWAVWFENAHKSNRIVKRESIKGATVSTVFLGLDHNYEMTGPPVLWETMIFDDPKFEDYQERCSGTREQAEAMHERAAEMVRTSGERTFNFD